jgi:hypothetical protein
MQDPHAREQTIARLLAKGVSAEEIAQLAADEAAHQATLLARAQIKRVQNAAPTAKAARTPAAKRTTSAAPTTPEAQSAPSAGTPTPPAFASLVPPPSKQPVRYHIRNWKAYNQSLVQRGSLTIWFDQAALAGWQRNQRAGQVGHPTTYADVAIVCALTLKAVYQLKLRQTEGFVRSLLQLLELDLPVPDYSTLSRRAASLQVALPRQAHTERLHVLVDASGVKVFGEGEWKVRQHGWSKHRTWRKMHLGVDEASREIVAQVMTPSSTSDKEMLPTVLSQVDEPIKQVCTDGAYDYQTCYEAVAMRGAQATIPPRENAAINEGAAWEARNANIRRIAEIGRKAWKVESGYHRRSLAETTMYRMKTIFGDDLQSRHEERQKTEVAIRCAALNRMTHLGMPDSYRVAAV